eukprot:m.144270 g.144270  ORF g.144270 m.144270 type:complete len:410 (+) comp13221_c2_seq1:190-1419(+)
MSTTPLMYEEFRDEDEVVGKGNNNDDGDKEDNVVVQLGSANGVDDGSYAIHNNSGTHRRKGTAATTWNTTGSISSNSNERGEQGGTLNTQSDLHSVRSMYSKILLIVSVIFLVAIVILIADPNIAGEVKEEDDFGACVVPFRVFDTHVQAFSQDSKATIQNEFNRILRQFWRSSVWGGVIVQTSQNVNSTRFLSKLNLSLGKLRGVVLFPSSSEIDQEEFSRYHDLGVRGVRLNLESMTSLQREQMYTRLENNEFASLFALIRDRRWHVVVTEVGAGWMRILPLLKQQNCRIVIDHFGFPTSVNDEGFQEILTQSNEYPLLWLKATPAITRLLSEPQIRKVVEEVVARVPQNRLIWGSNYHPEIEGDALYDTDRFTMVNWFPDVELRFHILSINPAELYSFEDSQNWWG